MLLSQIKKFFFFIAVFLLAVPLMLSAAGLVPCGGATEPRCDFDHLVLLADRIIDFLLFTLAVPLATVMFAYAGWLFLSGGDKPDKISKAKNIFWTVFIGLVIALAAWLIVNTITSALLSEELRGSAFWFL